MRSYKNNFTVLYSRSFPCLQMCHPEYVVLFYLVVDVPVHSIEPKITLRMETCVCLWHPFE